MSDFVQDQWQAFGENLQGSANHLAGGDADLERQFSGKANDFIEKNSPETYRDLLRLIAEGSGLAVAWQERSPVKSGRGDDAGNRGPEEKAYTESENHEPVPIPEDSMAEQAEQARQTP